MDKKIILGATNKVAAIFSQYANNFAVRRNIFGKNQTRIKLILKSNCLSKIGIQQKELYSVKQRINSAPIIY